jgi:hypothetical protein
MVTTPDQPSRVHYRDLRPDGQWGPLQSIDNSAVLSSGVHQGKHIGGRHPSLAVGKNGVVWVVWQDHRHCRPESPYNSIDNIEVYADRLTPGLGFTDTDFRLTQSAAAHLGDNGYHPKLASNAAGDVGAVWFDFHFDYDRADIFGKTSNAQGDFDLTETMAAMRLTTDGAAGGFVYNHMPDIAVSGAKRHIVYIKGLAGVGGDLYYLEAPIAGAVSAPMQVAAGVASFWEPPRVALGPDGSVWIVCGAPNGSERVRLYRKRPGQAAFDPVVVATSAAGRQRNPDLKIDAGGRVHLVWVDTRSGQHVYYGVYDPAVSGLVVEKAVTTRSADWARPGLVLDSLGTPGILFEERLNSTDGGAIWYTEAISRTSVPGGLWMLYQD